MIMLEWSSFVVCAVMFGRDGGSTSLDLRYYCYAARPEWIVDRLWCGDTAVLIHEEGG